MKKKQGMTIEEVIRTLKILESLIEWEYDMGYSVAIDEAIRILEEVKRKEDDLK